MSGPLSPYPSPDVLGLYHQEPVLPQVATAARRTARLLPTANAATALLLARILSAGALALGYLQIKRPTQRVFQQEAVARIKTDVARIAVLAAQTGRVAAPGPLQVILSGDAQRTLVRLEAFDPVFIHLVPVLQNDHTYKVLYDADPMSELPLDLMTEYRAVLRGIAWPLEVL